MGALGHAWRIVGAGITVFAVLVLLYLIVPTLAIVPLSFSSDSFLTFPPPGFSLRWYRAFLASGDYHEAILNSVAIGIPAALLATVLGSLGAVALVRGQLPGGRLVAALMLAPLIMPQMVLAIGLYPLMARIGIIGSYPAIVLGHALVAMPLVLVTVSAALRSYPSNLELAAMTLGADPVNTFRYITFPMIRVGLLVGFIFAFTFSFDELILAIFLTSPTTRTVPRLLWEQLNYQMTPIIAAATVTILCVTLACLMVAGLANLRRVRLTGAASGEAA